MSLSHDCHMTDLPRDAPTPSRGAPGMTSLRCSIISVRSPVSTPQYSLAVLGGGGGYKHFQSISARTTVSIVAYREFSVAAASIVEDDRPTTERVENGRCLDLEYM